MLYLTKHINESAAIGNAVHVGNNNIFIDSSRISSMCKISYVLKYYLVLSTILNAHSSNYFLNFVRAVYQCNWSEFYHSGAIKTYTSYTVYTILYQLYTGLFYNLVTHYTNAGPIAPFVCKFKKKAYFGN